jgi:3-hydroxyisobutyrate dehydrogenase-like beta-hydroxyacid dehydrogenase
MSRVLVLHPGAMGSSLIGALSPRHEVNFCAAGRSELSIRRAGDAGASDGGDLTTACANVDVVLSICPPAAALDIATAVASTGFSGLYIDANAIAPATMHQVDAVLTNANVVDAGVVGPPAWTHGTTRMFVSGPDAAEVVALFGGSPVDSVVVEGGLGAASALKMAYSAWSKGSSALLLGVGAYAARAGVIEPLMDEWARSQPGVVERLAASAQSTAPKAWRFVAEMHEIAASFGEVGLTGNLHEGAAAIYELLAECKDSTPSFDEVMELLGRPQLGS